MRRGALYGSSAEAGALFLIADAIYLSRVSLSLCGLVHAWVGQIVTFFAYRPTSLYYPLH